MSNYCAKPQRLPLHKDLGKGGHLKMSTEPGTNAELDQDAALAFAANVLRTLSAMDPHEWAEHDRLAARRLDMVRERGLEPAA